MIRELAWSVKAITFGFQQIEKCSIYALALRAQERERVGERRREREIRRERER